MTVDKPNHDSQAEDLPEEHVKTITTGGELTWLDVKNGVKSYCGKKAWRGRVPFTYWLPQYSLKDLQGDLVAGLTVGLTIVPQALAYVGIADLPLEVKYFQNNFPKSF